jgi:phage baseplate assembly protein W
MSNVVKYSALGIPFGMGYPLTFGGNSKTFKQVMDFGITIKNNIRNLLLTQKGEKDYDIEFGTDLTKILFQFQIGDPSLETAVEETIRSAIETYLPGVKVDALIITPLDTKDGAITVKLDFSADFTDPLYLEFVVKATGVEDYTPNAGGSSDITDDLL